jgi:hypothetical protein
VFAIGLIPNRRDSDAVFGGEHTGAKLRLGLMGETVADTDRVLLHFEHKQKPQL